MKKYIEFIKENLKIEDYFKKTELSLKKFDIVFDLLNQNKYVFYIDADDNYIFYGKSLNRLFIDEHIFNDFEYYFKNNDFYKDTIITSGPTANRVFIKRLKSKYINENNNYVYNYDEEFEEIIRIDELNIRFNFLDEVDRLEIQYYNKLYIYLLSYDKHDNFMYASYNLSKEIRAIAGNVAIRTFRDYLKRHFKYIDKNTEISFSD